MRNMKTGLWVMLVLCIAEIIDKNDHNKKVDKMFPDPDPDILDPEIGKKRSSLHVGVYGLYLILLGIVFCLMKCYF